MISRGFGFCCSGHVQELRLQVPVRVGDVRGREGEDRGRARVAGRTQDGSALLQEERSVSLV